MHSWIAAWLTASNSPTLPDNSLKIAVVTAISVVLAAAITGFATTYHRRSSSTPSDTAAQTFINDLLRRADVAEHQIETLERIRDQQALRVDELERYCWQAGIDPNTGQPVRRGNNGTP